MAFRAIQFTGTIALRAHVRGGWNLSFHLADVASRIQVNGLRGETETLDKMRARIQYDIDYMRNGSLLFDLMIIAKTLAVVWRDQNAY